MDVFRSFVIVFFIFSIPCSSYAQGFSKRFNEANYFFQQKKYDEVLTYLQSGNKFFKSENPEIIFLSAASHYYLNNLEAAEKEFISLLKEKSSHQVEAFLFLGQIRFHQQDFTNASSYLKSYLKAISPSHPNRNEVRNVIRNCATGLELQYKSPLAIVENLGRQINTPGDEFAPFWNPLYQNNIYFTSAKRTSETNDPPQTDLFFSSKENGIWQKPKSFNPILNSPKQETGLGFNTSGQVLYYFRGNNLFQGAIFTDTLKKSGKFKINPYLTSLNLISAHTPPHFVSDTLIIFASSSLGGQGGLDLFKTIKRNGLWTKPENLGSDVNSSYDENFPFLAPDGTTLYFSSNNPELSIGGYDIFKTSINKSGPIVNLGLPVNSTADDTHFSAGRDGITAYFASNRKTGFGARDLFTAYFFSPLNEMNSSGYSQGIAFKDNLSSDYYEFKSILLNGAEHPLESDYKPYFNAVIPILNDNPNIKLFISGYPHKDLSFSDGMKYNLNLLTDIHRFFSRASVNTRQITYSTACSSLFEKGNQGFSFRFSGELPMNIALNTTPLFEGENGNILSDSICFKWLLKEILFTDLQNIDLDEFKNIESLRIELNPVENKLMVYGGLFSSFKLAQWTNNQHHQIVAFLDGEKLSKEKATELISSYPVLSDYINQ